MTEDHVSNAIHARNNKLAGVYYYTMRQSVLLPKDNHGSSSI